jgi:hypothetical protein
MDQLHKSNRRKEINRGQRARKFGTVHGRLAYQICGEMMPSKNPGLMIAAFVLVGGWLVYDMATTREAQSTTVMSLQYIFLAGIAIGLIGAVLRLFQSQRV